MMRRLVGEFALFGLAPVAIVLVCMFGLIGGITEAQMFAPMYMAGLIIGATTAMMYGFAWMFRAVRWLVSGGR